ncbi:MAG TPA: lipid A export permease/ATP-binding protein MsbA [Burkholderiaceae bacterium]|nr:lipid A export permease/ATP-binding protein MsbA [Burkholderiaceae bacterium]
MDEHRRRDMSSAHPRLLDDPNLRRLLRMVLSHRRLLVFGLIATGISAATEPLIARLAGVLTDQALFQKEFKAVIWMPIAFVGLFIVRGLAIFGGSYLLNRVSQAVLVDLRMSMFDRMLHWPTTTFENTPSGVVISKFVNEATNALNLAAEVMSTAVRDSLIVLGLLAMLFYYNWQLTLLTMIVAPPIGIALRAFSRRLRRLNLENQVMLGEMTRAIQEAHEGQRVVKIYEGADYENGRFRQINEKLRGFAMRMQVAWSAATPIAQVLGAIGVAIVMTVALWQAQSAKASPGEFVTFLAAALLLLPALRHLSSLNGPLARMAAASESVFRMIDTAPEDDPGTRDIGRARGDVEFRRVSFRYAGADADALTEFDLSVRAGEMIAFVGPSGAGKSTAVHLVPRFIRPTAGEIRLDGVALEELSLASLRRQIALVSQDVVLFDDTIAANIAYGAQRGASVERIRDAADAAYLLPFIESLPQGFETRIGENAVKLSGGQRQRLSIARALLKDAPILLLDEATSSLDSESERFIQASLQRLMKGRTTFVVAHRLSTIERADRIVVLEHGRVVEIGSHGELIGRGGLYARLHSIQFASVENTPELMQ